VFPCPTTVEVSQLSPNNHARQRRAPDKDESVSTLLAGLPAEGPQPPILLPKRGYLFLDRDEFDPSFAADVPADLAAFMAGRSGVDALGGPVTDPAWRTKPSWYMVTTEDRMIRRRPSAPCPSGLGRR
jgi:hypothetical protein